MKQQRRYTVSLLMTAMMAGGMVLMAACADGSLVDDNHGEVPIVLTTVVQETGADVSRATANLQSTQLAASENIYATFSGYSGSVTKANAIYTSNGNGTTTIADAANQPYFTISGTSTTVNAYHGKSGGASGTQVTEATTSFSVALDQSSDAAYKASDLMHASTIITKIGPTACGVLQFTHKMSKIAVNASSTSLQIQAVRIVGGNSTIALSNDGSCTLGATSSPLSTSSYITMYAGGSNSTASCAALIPPQTITGSFMEVITNAGTITYSLSSKTFVSGMSYVYTIIATAGSIGLTIDITDWDEQNAVSLYNYGTDALEGLKAVNLGLPSGIKWANMNVGATSVTDLGLYFMWGDLNGHYFAESYPEQVSGWSQYRWGTQTDITKYYSSNNTYSWIHWSGSGEPDEKTTLEPADDPATFYLGTDWRMPTKDDLQELLDTKSNTTDYSWVWQDNYKGSGQAGYLITVIKEGPQNGNSIFLIAAGAVDGDEGFALGNWGRIPSSSLDEESPYCHYFLDIDSYGASIWSNSRCYAYPVRAVYARSLTDVTTDDVGKVICSNGHIHNTVSAVVCGGTASGIIAYVGDVGTADYSEGSNSYKGLALALYDYGGSLTTGGTTCQWYTVGSGTCITNGQSSTLSTAIGTTGDFGKGIDNTNRLATAACGSGHVHAAAQNAKNFSVARPSGASQWFLPTMYQWNLMVKAMCGKSTNLTTSTNNDYKADKFNEKITAAGGRGVLSSGYWSSVEYNASLAWKLYFDYGFAYTDSKSGYGRVRAVFAF